MSRLPARAQRVVCEVIIVACATAVARGEDFSRVRATISKALANGITPSVAVAVSHDGQELWAEAFGWADRERKVKATPQTAYGLGSISKPITATAIMILVSKGQLQLDSPANDYLGNAKLVARAGNASDATVKSLLQHTSGLGPYYETYFADEQERPPMMDHVIQRYGRLLWPAGKAFRYTNLDYGVLGRIVELQAGTTTGGLSSR